MNDQAHSASGREADPLGEMEIPILDREARAGTLVMHLTSVEQSLLYVLAARAGTRAT